MDINAVAKATGLPASTLRFYEEKGLITSNGRKGLRRLFHPGVTQRLALISLGRSVGFSLDELREMFSPEPPVINRALLLAKAQELDKKIKTFTAMRNGLVHAAGCKASSHFECPTFLRLLHIAGKNRFRQPAGAKKKTATAGKTKR